VSRTTQRADQDFCALLGDYYVKKSMRNYATPRE
jgi:hypothetical protein